MKFNDRDARMRVFETAHDYLVLPGIYMVARIDRRNFTRLTKEIHKFEAPYDERVRDMMGVEYNIKFDGLPAGMFRHKDHRFEWTRAEFQTWAEGVAERHGYTARFLPVGEEDSEVGAPTQMGVFTLG
jgi:hypothetical protein